MCRGLSGRGTCVDATRARRPPRFAVLWPRDKCAAWQPVSCLYSDPPSEQPATAVAHFSCWLESPVSARPHCASGSWSTSLRPGDRHSSAHCYDERSFRLPYMPFVEAEVHVRRILSKLDFRSRSQVAVWAAQRLSAQPEKEPLA